MLLWPLQQTWPHCFFQVLDLLDIFEHWLCSGIPNTKKLQQKEQELKDFKFETPGRPKWIPINFLFPVKCIIAWLGGKSTISAILVKCLETLCIYKLARMISKLWTKSFLREYAFCKCRIKSEYCDTKIHAVEKSENKCDKHDFVSFTFFIIIAHHQRTHKVSSLTRVTSVKSANNQSVRNEHHFYWR